MFLVEISKPPTRHDDLLEYVPTQVLAEYLRSKGIDGIKFNSSQNNLGVNFTFFVAQLWT